MMFHPLVRLLASKPHLLVDHMGAYAQLVGVQAAQAVSSLRSRALLASGLLAGLLLGAGLAGVAVLLVAVQPLSTMPAPWLLLAAPLLPLAVALGCAMALRQRPQVWTGTLLREQFAADAALLREAGAE